VFLLCLAPAGLVVGDTLGFTGQLSANPIEDIQDRFGTWAIRFIMITLAVTPLRRISGWNWLLRFRRPLGLFTFFYVMMHFLTWLILDQGLLLSAILEDLTKRPFITIGFAALLLLTAMAATSTTGMRRRMGRRWDKLHYSAYAVGVLGVWHYWWQVKKDTSDAWIYAVILAVLLGLRVYWKRGNPSRG
jgi:sulfoxide reductase heme-binding subunit YedZ